MIKNVIIPEHKPIHRAIRANYQVLGSGAPQ
jgi:hypothetical protein